MSGFCSTFSQLLKLFPRTEFQALVTRTHAARHGRGFTCWGHFVAMLFCQLGRAHSLREILRRVAAATVYEVVEERRIPRQGRVERDQIIRHLAFGATTIAAIYKDRWQIELFFKALKQNLKIKTFVGTSANALKVQVWAAWSPC